MRAKTVRQVDVAGPINLTIADQSLPSFDGARRAMRAALNRESYAYVHPLPTTPTLVVDHHLGSSGLDASLSAHLLPVGAKTALSLALRTVRATGRRIVLLTPTYSGLRSIAATFGDVHEICLRDAYGYGSPSWQRLEDAMAERPSAVAIVNPDNPTGQVWRESELRRVDAIAADVNGVVVCDEVHRDLVWSGAPTSFASALRASKWIVIGSLAKAFNLGAIPFSWTIESGESMRRGMDDAMRQLGIYQSSLVGEAAAAACLSSEGRRWLAARRERLRSLVDRASLAMSDHFEVVPPDAGFLLWVRSREGGVDLANRLLREGVLSSSGLRFGAPRDVTRLNVAMESSMLEHALRLVRTATRRES